MRIEGSLAVAPPCARSLPANGRTHLHARAREAREIARRYAADAAEEAARGRHVRGSRILKARFLEIQAHSLEGIAAGIHGIGRNADGTDDAMRIDWLARVIDVFQDSLLHHLAGRMPFDADRTRTHRAYSLWMESAMVRGLGAGAWWNDVDCVLDDLYSAPGPLRRPRVRIGGRSVGRGAPAVLVASALMAYHHLANDLRVSLTRHGIGDDSDWRNIARVSDDAQRKVFGDRLLFSIGHEVGRRCGLNVRAWRNHARQLAKERIVKTIANGRPPAEVLPHIVFEGLAKA